MRIVTLNIPLLSGEGVPIRVGAFAWVINEDPLVVHFGHKTKINNDLVFHLDEKDIEDVSHCEI